jgi:hypothetical protein
MPGLTILVQTKNACNDIEDLIKFIQKRGTARKSIAFVCHGGVAWSSVEITRYEGPTLHGMITDCEDWAKGKNLQFNQNSNVSEVTYAPNGERRVGSALVVSIT